MQSGIYMHDGSSGRLAVRDAPYRIVTERLVLRCYDPTDAPLLKAAIDGSLEHLRAWMPWAYDDPVPLGQMAERLRQHVACGRRLTRAACLLHRAARPRDLLEHVTFVLGIAADRLNQIG